MQQYISSFCQAQQNVYYDSKTGKYKHIMGISFAFELDDSTNLVPINKLSMALNELLAPQGVGFDEGYVKPQAEYLVYANLPAVKNPKELSVTVNGQTKKIIQQPKRLWKQSGTKYVIEQVDSDEVVPLSYTKAYGSAEYSKNPTGVGYFGKKMSEELPLFEYRGNEVKTPIDKGIEPAGFAGKHVSCGSRKTHLGKYSKSEQKTMMAAPSFPKSMDDRYFMMSSPDQWLASIEPNTKYKLEGFTQNPIEGETPSYSITIITQGVDGSYKQHEGVVDTMVLMPSINRGMLVTRFVFETNSINLDDKYEYMMIQLNDMKKPHNEDDNKKALENRIADPSGTGLVEEDLLPLSMKEEK